MPFRPNPNDTISISNTTYTFTEHPAAPGMAYGQAGRRGTVYQLTDEGGGLWALKVFLRQYREPRLAGQAEKISRYASVPGLQACTRTVLTGTMHRSVLRDQPDLAYAVLMPWITGKTWQETLMQGQVLSAEKSLAMVSSLLLTLASMEERGLAHCDLSGPNVIFDASGKAALVDLEEMYSPELVQPEQMPGGSPGYGHKTSPQGLWNSTADRFAGAVLIGEILGWVDERVQQASWGEGYFQPEEVGTNCERYQLLNKSLKQYWGDRAAEIFQQAWESDTLRDCSMFAEWIAVLPERSAGLDAPEKSQGKAKVESGVERGRLDPGDKTCPVCGAAFAADLSICPHCESGRISGDLKVAYAPDTLMERDRYQPVASEQSQQEVKREPQSQRRKKGFPWLFSTAAAVLIGIGLWAGGVLGGEEPEQEVEPQPTEIVSFLPDDYFGGIPASSQDLEARMAPQGALLRSGYGNVNDLAYSADGSTAVLASDIGLFVFDAKSLGLLWNLPSRTRLTGAAWSPDHRFIAVGDERGRIHILSSENGWLIASMDGVPLEDDAEPEEGAAEEVESDSVSIDKSAIPENIYSQMDQAQAVHGGHTGSITALAWSPDGHYLVSTSSRDDMLIIWDMVAGERRLAVEVDPYWQRLEWSADSLRVAFCADNRVYILDVVSGEISGVYSGGDDDVEDFTWSPDNRWMAVGIDNNSVVIRDVEQGGTAYSLPDLESDPVALAWSPDSERLAVQTGQDEGLVWNPEQGKKLSEIHTGNLDIEEMLWLPDGSSIAARTRSGRLALFDAESGEEAGRLSVLDIYFDNRLRYEQSLTWSSDGSRLAVASPQNEINIWSAGMAPALQSYHVCDWVSWGNGVRFVRWREDDLSVLVGCPDGTIRAWPETDQVLSQSVFAYEFEDYAPFWLNLSPDSDRYFAYFDGSSIIGQRISDDSTFMESVLTSDSIHSISWSSDQEYAAFGWCTGNVYLYNVDSAEHLYRISGNSCMHVDWAPGSDIFLTAYSTDDDEGILKIFNSQGNQIWWTQAHAGTIESTAFSPDGKWIATGAENGEIKIWEAETGDWWRTMTGHLDDVAALAWSPDGHTLASLSLDNTMIQWDVSDLE